MRIALSCQQDLKPHALPAYRFWAESFRAAFAEAGHACLEAPGCDWAEGLEPLDGRAREAWRGATWQRAVEWIRAEHAKNPVDLFLSYLYPAQVDAGAVAEVRSMGIPCVNFFCDNVRLFRKAPQEYRCFDLNWVPEAEGVELYRRAGIPSIYAPMPCWVEPRWRTCPGSESLPPTFVGTRDMQRERLFAEAYGLGLQMELHGHGWSPEMQIRPNPPQGRGLSLLSNQWNFMVQHGPAAFARKVWYGFRPPRPVAFDFKPWVRESLGNDAYWQVLRECRVCVGVNRFPSLRRPIGRPPVYSRLRDIEAPMVGAAYLTEYAPGLEDLFEIGAEIEVYREPAELVEKAAELDRDAPRRRRLRERGQRRALADHGIAQTLSRISRRLGLA